MNEEKFFSKKNNIILLALLCAFLWGCCYPFIKLGYQYFEIESSDIPSKLLLASIRFIIAGLMVLIFALFRKKNTGVDYSIKSSIKSILLLCLFQTVLHYIFTYIGLANTTGAKGSVLKELSTFLIIMAAPLLYAYSKFGVKELIGCILGFFGIIVINFDEGLNFSFTFLGEGFVLIAALSVTTGHLLSKKLLQKNDPVFVTGCQQLLGGIILLLIGLLSHGKLNNICFLGVLNILFLSSATAVAYVLWMILLKYNIVSKVSIFGLGTPVFGTLMSGLFLGKNIFTVNNILSLLFVCGGIYIVNREGKVSKSNIDEIRSQVF